MRFLSVVLAVPFALVGCEDEVHQHGPVDMRATAPDVAKGFQLRFPDNVVEVGGDVQTCFVPDIEFAEDTFIVQADAYQGDVGHHVQIYASAVPRTPGASFDCSDLSVMSSLLPLVTPNSPLKEKDNAKQLPENFFVRIPAGARIVMQSHYVNYTDQPIVTADVVNFETVDSVEGMTEASFFVLSHNTFTAPTGPSTVVYECDVEEETQLLYAMGHMHEHGTSIDLKRRAAGATEDETLYEVESWTSEFRDDAPTDAYPPSAPLVLNAGDHLTLTCNFDNATGAEIPWPKEMCVIFSAYWPARGDGFVLCE